MATNTLLRLLNQLVDEIRRTTPAAANKLRPGLSLDTAKAKLSALPYQIAADAIVLYSWADGADDWFEMLPGAYFIPLGQALEEFKIVHGMAEELQQVFPQTYRDCFRFLSDRSDGGYAFGRIDSPSEGQIVGLCIHAPWLLAFEDLEHLLLTSIECYRRRIIGGESGIADFEAYYRLAAELNPGMEHWQV